ncbi:MAG: MFS transporter [Planctomycetaceae bacterium]
MSRMLSESNAPTNSTADQSGEWLRSIAAAQFCFTVGNVLTTGAFLYYFANALHPSAFLFSVLLVTPEVSEIAAVWSRSIILRLGSRKQTWLWGYSLARVVALAIPALAFPGLRPENETVAFGVLVVSLGISHAFQSIAYTAYISWMSDLVPRSHWGGMFALRRIASVSVMILLPAGAAILRRDWSTWREDEVVRRAYVGVFLVGNGLLWLVMIPVIRLPDVPIRWSAIAGDGVKTSLVRLWHNRPLRWVVLASFWLAAFQGLTQGVFFQYQVRLLGLPLAGYLALSGMMYFLQIPASWLGGGLSDGDADVPSLFWGLLLVSTAMGFWLLARPGHSYWLGGAYAVWGLFGLVNVCLRNLLLKLAPESDNAMPIALLEHLAGFFAGGMGLLGGWLLGELISRAGASALWPYATLFLVSWFGRATAALWLLPLGLSVRQPTIDRRSVW